MLGASRRNFGGGWALLLYFALVSTGCSKSDPDSLKVAPKPESDSKEKEKPGEQAKQLPASEFALRFLQMLQKGEVSANDLSLAFKKKIAWPREGNELEYDPDRVNEYLKKMATGKFPDSVSMIDTATGPFFYGQVATEAGKHEGFVLRLTPSGKTGWQVDWLHRSPFVVDSYNVDSPGPDLVGAQLAAQCFVENVLGGDPRLAESLLSTKWKQDHYWSKAPSNAARGYDRALVMREIGEWRKGAYTEYAFAHREVAAGKPALFEIIAQDADKKMPKTFKLTMNKEANGEWVVGDVEVK